MIVETNKKVFLYLFQKNNDFGDHKKRLNSKNYHKVAITILLDLLIKKCIFKVLLKIHYLHLMINDALNVIKNVSLGDEDYNCMTRFTLSEALTKPPLANFLTYYL